MKYPASMAITLTPEQEAHVKQAAKLLGWNSPEAYLDQRLREIHDDDVTLSEHRQEIRALLEEGWADIKLGNFLFAEDAKADIEAKKREALADRSAA